MPSSHFRFTSTEYQENTQKMQLKHTKILSCITHLKRAHMSEKTNIPREHNPMDKIKTNMSITGEKRWLEGPLGARPNLDSVPSR